MDNNIALKIEEFMSEINNDWSNLKKSRFIFVKLGQLYNYDPKFAYANSKMQGDILAESIKNSINELTKNNNLEDFINDENKICISLSNIYVWLLKRAGVESIVQLSSDVFINTEQGRVLAKLEEGLLSCKMMTKPEGFYLQERLNTRRRNFKTN